MPINYDDIIDLQYNPFTQTYDPYWVGWTGHPTGKERSAETHVIPSDGYLQLYGTPQENIPSTTRCFIGLFELQEVASNITPAYDQFAVWYDELGLGWVRLNPGRSGHTASFWYYDLGTIHQKDTLDSRVPSSGDTTITGEKTFTEDIIGEKAVFATDGFSCRYVTSAGAVSTKKLNTYIVEIGFWDMDTNAGKSVNLSSLNLYIWRIASMTAIIFKDYEPEEAYPLPDGASPVWYKKETDAPTGLAGCFFSYDGAQDGLLDEVDFERVAGSLYDSTTYNRNDINRGYIFIQYFED